MPGNCDFSFTRDDAAELFDDDAWADHDEGFDGFWADLLERRGVDGDAWTCPHDGVDGGDCVFHRGPDTVEADDQARALVEALEAVDRPATDGGCRRSQFVGATFGDLDLAGRDLSLPADARVDLLAATFAGEAEFRRCTIAAPTFLGATFEERARFDGASFVAGAAFDHARFDAEARFVEATFENTVSTTGTASFDGTTFGAAVRFVDAGFDHDVGFDGVDCGGPVTFLDATVAGDLGVTDGAFREVVYLSSLAADGDVLVDDCTFFDRVVASGARVGNRLRLDECRLYRDEADADTDVADATPDDSDPLRLDRVDCDLLGVRDCSVFRTVDCSNARVESLYFGETDFLDRVDLGGGRFSAVAARGVTFHGQVNLINGTVSRGELEDTRFDGFLRANQSTLRSVDFSESELNGATFEHTDLTAANLSGLDLRGVDLSSATLSRAVLYGTDLRGANLSAAALGDVHLDDETRLLHPPVDSLADEYRLPLWLRDALPERLVSSARSYCAPDPAFEATDEVPAAVEGWEDRDEAKTTYRRIEAAAGDNSRSTLQSRAFVRGQDVRYDQLRRETSRLDARYLFSRLQRGVFVYGESFARVVVVSLSVILAFGLLYPLGGWTATVAPDGTTTPLTVARALDDPLLLWRSVYHSAMMFATGNRYGGIEATTTLGQALTSVEALLGPTMLALVVFVLGRRAAR